jgi:uncharacterized protein DUF4397
MTIKMKKILTAVALASMVMFMNSCKKDDDDGPVEPANYSVIHASTGSLAVELYLDDVKASASPIAFGTASAYTSIAPKQYNVKLAAVNTINPVAETSVNMNEGRFYSIFAYDTLLNNKVKVFTTEDDLSAPASGKAKIRFIHLSPNTQVNKVAVDIAANGTVIFPNRTYADVVTDGSKANFATVDAGTYTVDVRLAGSTTVTLLSVPGVVVEAGKIYTIVAKGILGRGGSNELAAQLIVNK